MPDQRDMTMSTTTPSDAISNAGSNSKQPGGCTGKGWQPGQSGNARGLRPGGSGGLAKL